MKFFFNGCSILFSSCFLSQCIIHISFRVWLYSKCHFLPLEQGGDYSVLCTLKRKTPPAEGNQWLQTSPEVCPGIKSSPCCRSGCDKLVEARKVYLNFNLEEFYWTWERCCVREYEPRCTKWLFNHSRPLPHPHKEQEAVPLRIIGYSLFLG